MEQVLVLLLMLAAGTHAFLQAADTACNATGGSTSCSVSSGASVYIQVMANASGHLIQCKKNTTVGSTKVFSLKNEQVKMYMDNVVMEFFIHNGTLKITDAKKNDTGQYVCDIFTDAGIHVRLVAVHLDVKDAFPLLIVIVVSACAAVVLLVTVSVICICRKKSASTKQTPLDLY